MSQGREVFLDELMLTLEKMINDIEEREVVEPDFQHVRDCAEDLKEEVRSLQE